MEKASRALRRSGVKLLSLGGANSDLSVTLSELKNTRTSAKAFMNAQNLASRDMLRWAHHEENRAIQDVINHMSELNLLWTEVQTEFLDNLKEYRQMFEMILAGEKQVYLAKQNYNVCEQKEAKYRKELRRIMKKGALESEIRMLQSRIQQAERAKELAYAELSDKAKENECLKLIRLKGGLLKASEAYIEMSTKCSLLFTAQRDVVLQLPDVNGNDLSDLKYMGRTTTTYVVEQARNQLKKYRRNSQTGTNLNEPPPPYTPTPPDSSPTLPTQEVIVPVRNPTPPVPQARQSNRTTPPPYQAVDSSPSPTDSRRRQQRHSLPATLGSGSEHGLLLSTSSGNRVVAYDTMPVPRSRQITQPTQECNTRSETLTRTGSGGRIIPRNPAPPVPQARSSFCSTSSSDMSSSERLAQVDSKPRTDAVKKSESFFRFDSRDVATQSQNAMFQSDSLYSNVQSTNLVHVCPSGLPTPAVQEHVEKSGNLQSENSSLSENQSHGIELAAVSNSSDNKDIAISVEDDTGSSTDNGNKRSGNRECRGDTVNEVNSNTDVTGAFAGISESGFEMLHPFKCLPETSGNTLEEISASQYVDEFQNIPFMDSMSVEQSPTVSMQIPLRDDSLFENDRKSNQETYNVHNKQTDQGTSIGADQTDNLTSHGVETVKSDTLYRSTDNKTTGDTLIHDKLATDTDTNVSIGFVEQGDADDEYDTAEDEDLVVGAVGGAD